jgi:acetyl-CoA carboxylase biotin carboxylase subunit
MFNTILIANRGEIACRIIQSCRALGVRTVAVFSEADRDAVHVGLADSAVCIGPAEARLSYLAIDAILDAAKQSGADAIHPGYGFLAENAGFAEACAAANITFIGPSPGVIARMGSKIEAKAVAVAAGVPVVPGYSGNDQSDQNLIAEAEALGVPLLIKASAGGGGRGMRRVDDLANLEQALASARAEAVAAFGNGDVLLEKLIERPRHVEVQLLSDHHGTHLHLYERDCSIQRNHQKVIEEAPAPDLPDDTRARLTGDALKLARAIGYDSAGTAEFMLDRDSGEIYFLEMNTRLQVEHPVTELITGIDIVEWQIRVAAGEALPFAQEDIAIKGWAIEARIAAEDPSLEYRPQTGTVRIYREPESEGLRIDTGLQVGTEITPYYDSMMAKLIAHGPDRATATARLNQALHDFRMGGVGHNIGFLADIVAAPAFAAGDVDTTFIERAFPGGWQSAEPTNHHLAEAALAYYLDHVATDLNSPWQSLGAWRLTGTGGSTVLYVGPDNMPARISGRPGDYTVEINGETFTTFDDADDVDVRGSTVTLFRDAACFDITVQPPEQALLNRRQRASHTTGDAVTAPMPGLVAEVLVEVGQAVEAGETVVVLEAMKLMQNLGAPKSGIIASVHCRPGETVSGGATLIEFKKEEE